MYIEVILYLKDVEANMKIISSKEEKNGNKKFKELIY